MSIWALQQAIFDALTSDATLMGKVSGVFDQVPQDGAGATYVVIGDGEAREWDTDLDTGLDADVMIHVWDRAHRGRRTVKQVQDDIRRILHRRDLIVGTGAAVLCICELTDSFLDPDGLTHHGVQRFRVVIEE